MFRLPIDFDAFLEWLATHQSDEIIGFAGRCFDSPLSRYLSGQAGYVVGVDASRYGRAVLDACRWSPLPSWASLFTEMSEKLLGRPLTAAQVLDLLIQVETALPLAG